MGGGTGQLLYEIKKEQKLFSRVFFNVLGRFGRRMPKVVKYPFLDSYRTEIPRIFAINSAGMYLQSSLLNVLMSCVSICIKSGIRVQILGKHYLSGDFIQETELHQSRESRGAKDAGRQDHHCYVTGSSGEQWSDFLGRLFFLPSWVNTEIRCI